MLAYSWKSIATEEWQKFKRESSQLHRSILWSIKYYGCHFDKKWYMESYNIIVNCNKSRNIMHKFKEYPITYSTPRSRVIFENLMIADLVRKLKISIFLDIIPRSSLKCNRRIPFPCHLLSRWFLARIILRPWRWRRHIPPKSRLALNGIHDVIF
jgi:hypothetical protein